jgi:hypothetical protein
MPINGTELIGEAVLVRGSGAPRVRGSSTGALGYPNAVDGERTATVGPIETFTRRRCAFVPR